MQGLNSGQARAAGGTIKKRQLQSELSARRCSLGTLRELVELQLTASTRTSRPSIRRRKVCTLKRALNTKDNGGLAIPQRDQRIGRRSVVGSCRPRLGWLLRWLRRRRLQRFIANNGDPGRCGFLLQERKECGDAIGSGRRSTSIIC